MKTDVIQLDNVAIKVLAFEGVGDFMVQHVHKFDHYHYVLNEEVTVFCDGMKPKDYSEGQSILIRAGLSHKIVSKTENARSACVHILTPDEMGGFDFESVIV